MQTQPCSVSSLHLLSSTWSRGEGAAAGSERGTSFAGCAPGEHTFVAGLKAAGLRGCTPLGCFLHVFHCWLLLPWEGILDSVG